MTFGSVTTNVITKKLEIRFNGLTTTIDNAEEISLNYIITAWQYLTYAYG